MKLKTIGLIIMSILILSGCQNQTPPVKAVDTDTIIVGGGVSGLTSAYFLDKKSHDFILLEKEEVVGGKAISGYYDGFYYAKGTEYIGYPEGILNVMIRDLDIEMVEIPSPMDIHYANDKRYYGYAGLVLHLIEESSVEEFNRFVDEVMDVYYQYNELPYFNPNSSIAHLDQITAASWLESLGFSQVYYDTYNVTSKGLFGATLDEVSALNMIPEIAFDFEGAKPLTSSDIETLESMNKAFKSKKGSMAYSFKTGISEIPLAVYERVKDRVKLSSLVTKVEKIDGIYHVTYTDVAANEVKVLTSNQVILAVPSPMIPLMTKDLLTQEQLDILNEIPYASYITAALYTDTYLVNDAFDIAVPDGLFFTDIYDATWIQRTYDETVKDKVSSVLSLYIAPESYQSKALLTMDDEMVLEQVYQDLSKIKGYEEIKSHVTGFDLYRMEYAYPIMIPGAYERLSQLHKTMNGSLQLAGDYMIYPTLEGAVESGKIAANRIIQVKKEMKDE